jgi:uncharacterized repeat protein (TIGR01451 family)
LTRRTFDVFGEREAYAMPTADLSVTMDDGKTTVVPGTTDTYTIIVTNNGPDTLSSLTLIPGFRLSNPIFSPPSAGSYDQLAEVWSGLSLATGQSASITLSGAIPNAPGSLINAVAVAPPAGTTDPNPANNIATDTDTVTPLATADLSVTVTDGKTTVAPGDIDTYTITVTNNGPDTLSSLTLIEAVALSSPIFGPPSAGSYDPLTGAWTGLSLATGQTVSLTLSGAVTPSATGSLTNIVAVAPPAGTSDINPANNAASDTDTVTVVISPNPSPPPATSANMILRRADGLYATYDIGNNTILAGYPLVQVGTDWRFAGLGGFQARDTSDMLLRNASTGGFQVYDISNNNIANTAFLGNVGMDWQVMGFGNFSSRGETDMILRNSNTGAVEVYDIANNQITGANLLGSVGLDWQFSGVGNFSGAGGSDLLLRNANTGGLEVYDIANNQITGANLLGSVGLDWQFSGVGNFSGVAGETDLLLRNVNTGALEVYDINNNQLTNAAFIGTVGLDWQFAGVAPVRGAGMSDLILRNVTTGAFEAYNIANNQIVGAANLGQVGLEWQVGGFAADPATAATAQLVQAMAGFGGGGAAEELTVSFVNADTPQQELITIPQHA